MFHQVDDPAAEINCWNLGKQPPSTLQTRKINISCHGQVGQENTFIIIVGVMWGEIVNTK